MSLASFPTSLIQDRGTPSSAGGFYRYPKTSRTLPSIDNATVTSSISSHHLSTTTTGILGLDLNDKLVSDDVLDVRRLADERRVARTFNPVGNTRVLKAKKSIRLKKDSVRYDGSVGVSATDSIFAPTLVSSYAKCRENILHVPDPEPTKEKGSQAGLHEMRKLDFTEFTEYNEWISKYVDPFIKTLRKVIVNQKPEIIEEYVLAYCVTLLQKEKEPVTYLDRELPSVLPINTANSVTSETAIIKVDIST